MTLPETSSLNIKDKQPFIPDTDTKCKTGKDLMSKYSIWNFLEDNVADTGVDLGACNATGIVMNAMTFLNTIIYFTIIMIVLIALLFFCYDYIVVLNSPWGILKVKLKNKPIIDDQTKKPVSLLPYEIKSTNDATTQYICGDKHQRWTDTWMKALGTPEHQYKDIATVDKSQQSHILDNVNCKKMYEKTKICNIVKEDGVQKSTTNGLYGIQNSTFYNAIPISRVQKRLMKRQSPSQCTDETMVLNVIDPKSNMCERMEIDDTVFNQSLIIIRKIYSAIIALCVWLLIIKMIFNNYNYTLNVNNDMGWLNLFLILYGMIVPMVLFLMFWKNPSIQYRTLDGIFGTSFYRKWSANGHAKQTRNIALLVSIVVVFVPLVTYMSIKASMRPSIINKDTVVDNARLSIDELSQFFIQHKRNSKNDGYVLKSFFLVVALGTIGVIAIQLIKTIINL